MWFRFLWLPLAILAGVAVLAVVGDAYVVTLAYPNLPSLQALTEYQPKIPLRIYTAEGVQIGEFGEERRAMVGIGEVPDVLKNAIISAEDERFYEHAGIDYIGVLRAGNTRYQDQNDRRCDERDTPAADCTHIRHRVRNPPSQ